MADDEARRLLRAILSPAEAQSLVMPPPDHAPASGPAESTPLTGSLAQRPRGGLASHFANARGHAALDAAPDRGRDPRYIKVSSKGEVGYLPKANLPAAMEIDRDLKVLD